MLVALLSFLLITSTLSLQRYGPNKPHMLFQIGERHKQTVSFGWGYYYDSGTNHSQIRLKYQNTNNGLYCNVLQHNGQTHIKQETRDSKYNVDSLIKYQLLTPNQWEAEISMNHSSTGESTIKAFIYMAVENNDYKMVDLKKIQSARNLVLKAGEYGEVAVEVVNRDFITNVFSIKGMTNPEVFGVSLNVSENWNARNIISHYVGVKQVYRYPELERTDKKDLREWQDSMVEIVKSGDWYDRGYTFVIVEFEVEKENSIYVKFGDRVTSSRQFDQQRFNKASSHLASLYTPHEKSQFLQHVQSNLLSGIAWYYGPLYTQNSLVTQQQTFTHSTTPSRLIFPRSFLWDDGFHMMVLVKNYKEKVVRFLGQWMDKIDVFGWVARQQIRGYEISSMMPEIKFVFQDSFEMNPPTLMLPIQYLIKHNPDDSQLESLLYSNFWKIEKWYKYFKETQSHYDMTDQEEIVQQIKFRWRCKDSCENGNFMGSGLDDFPRQDTRQRSKQHVDLISWLYLFADSLEKIAKYVGEKKAMRFYKSEKQFYNETLFKQYLDKDNIFKDIVVSHNHNINEYITHIGYINLFPFFTGMIANDSPQFHATLNIMKDEKLLWSEDGIRSLSLNDTLYGKGDNYWRGAMWMPINYLILRACKLYYPETTKQFYEKLRSNIVNTVEKNYNSTGYLFENYFEGKGNRGFPFYGWTSLVNSVILEVY